jgi:kynurenine formamidase
MPAHRAFPKPVLLPHYTHEGTRADRLGEPTDPFTSATSFLAMVDHVGTHVDSFFHTSPTGRTIDEMPIEMFMGKAVCLDLTHIPDLGDIDVADLEKAALKAKVAIDGHIVLINTGLHRRHFPTDKMMWCNPGITAAATHWLADRGSRIHGVEGPSTDKPTDDLFANHRVCRDRSLTHYEWLCNLETLVGRGEFQFQGLPLKITRGTGGPARAVAFLD